jgi:hypothetical protein
MNLILEHAQKKSLHKTLRKIYLAAAIFSHALLFTNNSEVRLVMRKLPLVKEAGRASSGCCIAQRLTARKT